MKFCEHLLPSVTFDKIALNFEKKQTSGGDLYSRFCLALAVTRLVLASSITERRLLVCFVFCILNYIQ